ncbi:hypothetical protein L6164_020220 [Bauhinia variegata]|uniref:Uncharacterized protein n=1 Tax=Bauhinia variegata TaxID=167791 RepID=A0ACB9MUP5_BAUVA|nr:hypothetical protein L6164_020220 [Bauhinia variegata]
MSMQSRSLQQELASEAGRASFEELEGRGFLETVYLTFLKLTNSEALCPIGGGNCSAYSTVIMPLFSVICLKGLNDSKFACARCPSSFDWNGCNTSCQCVFRVNPKHKILGIILLIRTFSTLVLQLAYYDCKGYWMAKGAERSWSAVTYSQLSNYHTECHPFWCSHCLEQKEMFGREAAEHLDCVECFPDGFITGTKMDKACSDVKIEGFLHG